MRPFPGAFTYADGERLIVWKAEPIENPRRYAGRIPGRVVAVSRRHGYVDVLTGDGVLRLVDVQFGDAQPCAAAEAIRSVRTKMGLRPADLLERIAALEHEIRRMQGLLRQLGIVAAAGGEAA